ncbi:MAG: DUF2659 family protein [Rickettsiaceae bacterium]|nr:DUF2659 family protein [Rickettsiaceae bacterium]
MSDILDEVLNDAKDEKRLMLFRKSLPLIIVVTCIIAIFIGGYSWYQNKTNNNNRKMGDKLVTIVSGYYGDNDKTMAALEELVQNSNNKQEELSALKLVNRLMVEKKSIAAMEKLQQIIDNKNYHEVTTAFARLLWIGNALDEKTISDSSQTKITEYFQYFVDENQPFFVTATLMKALFYKKRSQNDLSAEYANIVLQLKDAPFVAKEQASAILASM